MRKYISHDYLQICDWFVKRNMKAPAPFLLPPNGVIVDGVAAGFLLLTDSRLGILDFFISNPDKDRYERVEALSNITTALTNTAKNFNIASLICNTKFGSIKDLANRHGFNYLGEYSSFSKEL